MNSIIAGVYFLSNLAMQPLSCPKKLNISHNKEKQTLTYKSGDNLPKEFSYKKKGFVEISPSVFHRNFYITAPEYETFIHSETSSNRIGWIKNNYTLRLLFQQGQLTQTEEIHEKVTKCVFELQ